MTQQINLLEPSLLPKREWCTGRSIVVVAGLVASAVGGHYLHESSGIKRLLASGSSDSNTTPAAEAVDPIESQLREGQSRLERGELLLKAVAGLTDLPRDNAQRLQALIAAMPDTVWLQQVEFSGERGVRIAGGATQSAALADFSQRLGRTTAFQGLPLHVYALAPRERETDAASDATPAPDAQTERTPPAAPLYGFELSSVDAEQAAKGPQ